MNPPMEDGERERINDLVRRVEAIEVDARQDQAALVALVRDLRAEMNHRFDESAEHSRKQDVTLLDLTDNSARRRDLLIAVIGPLSVTVIGGLIAVLA